MLRIAVVDDELSFREEIQAYFARYQEAHDCQLQLSVFDSAEAFLSSFAPDYDLVILDIDMPGMDGLEAARRLRRMDPKVLLMFVTNLAQYAINGYEVSAIDYIVKPLDYDKFEFKLDRALRLAASKTTKKVLIRTEEGMIALNQEDVTYVEVQGHTLYYHTLEGIYQTRGTLKQALADFPPPQFYPSHQSYIVNLAYVEEVRNYEVIAAGEKVFISRPKRKAFMEALAAFYNK